MPPSQLIGDLGGGRPDQFRVWSDHVIILPPLLQFSPGLPHRGEQPLVEAFIPEPTIEAFDERILRRLSGCVVMPFDVALLRPAQDLHAGEFRPIVADDHMRLAALADQGCQFARYPCTGQRCVGCQRKAPPAIVFDHGQDAEPAPVNKAVGDEVQAPALVCPLRQGHRRTRFQSPLAATPATHPQVFLALDAQQLLVVGPNPFTRQQILQTPITEPAALSCQLA
jgi:hypothetical protein